MEILNFERKSSRKSPKLVQAAVSSSADKNAAGQLPNVDVLSDDEMDGLIKRCGNLEKLIRSVAYILRMVGRGQKVKHDMCEMGKTLSWKKRGKEILASSEYIDAYNLISWEQEKRLINR